MNYANTKFIDSAAPADKWKWTQMPIDVSRAPASASPLWVIALFIALSEATAGVAAIVTNGTVRLIFACFAVAFPTIVFGVFVWLLVKHAPNLYSPGQYNGEITPEIYRAGISRTEYTFLGHAVAESLIPPPPEGDSDKDRDADVEEAARRFEAAIKDRSVSVSLNAIKPGADLVQIPVNADTDIQWLLDQIFFELDGAVQAGTYGRAWVLVDDEGRRYDDMGMSWAKRQLGLEHDPRSIPEVGILPGAHLTATWKSRIRRSTHLSRTTS